MYFAKDAEHIFTVYGTGIPTSIIPGADPDSFATINQDYTKDARHVYFRGDYPTFQAVIVPSADPRSFREMKNDYWRDDQGVFFRGKRVDVTNLDALESLM